MILILSHNNIDEPTNDVLDWIRFYNFSALRINGNVFDFGKDFSQYILKEKLKFDEEEIQLNNVSVVFYRRWVSSNRLPALSIALKEQDMDDEAIIATREYLSFFSSEFHSVSKTLFNTLYDKKWIPHFNLARGNLNKLRVLKIAKKIGLNVPDTLITSSKRDALEFLSNHVKVINKAIADVDLIYFKGHKLNVLTKEVSRDDLEKLNDTFFPSLFQEKVEKTIEIRTFFIEDDYYSMAIFSQRDSSTSIDYRNYNLSKPNRFVPFNLPYDIIKKLKKLMKKLELNTGSIDLMLEKYTNNYFFLEVNPVGQLGMVSANCNYHLESIIAQRLIAYEQKNI
ncbi:grasp-with-spasm system ATP-grasp peptide maturase [Flavobacteriaceae bacterium M23B6Z8]